MKIFQKSTQVFMTLWSSFFCAAAQLENHRVLEGHKEVVKDDVLPAVPSETASVVCSHTRSSPPQHGLRKTGSVTLSARSQLLITGPPPTLLPWICLGWSSWCHTSLLKILCCVSTDSIRSTVLAFGSQYSFWEHIRCKNSTPGWCMKLLWHPFQHSYT